MKKITKRIMAFLVAIAMIVTMMPMTAKAEGEALVEIVGVERVEVNTSNIYFTDSATIKSIQDQVNRIYFNKDAKTIIVDADISEMNLTERYPAFAIAVKFADMSILKRGADREIFDSAATDTQSLGWNYNITDPNTALLWINGETRVGETTLTLYNSNNDAVEYTLVVNDSSKVDVVPNITEVSKVVVNTENTSFVDREAINNIQQQVTDVELDKDNRIITVKANIAGMPLKCVNNGNSHEAFAIQVKFEDLSVLKIDGALDSAAVDTKTLEYNYKIKDTNTALIWLYGGSRYGKGTTVSEITFVNKNDETKKTTYTVVVEDTSTQGVPTIESVNKLQSGSVKEIDNYEIIKHNQDCVSKVEFKKDDKEIIVDVDIARMKAVASGTAGYEGTRKTFALMMDFGEFNVSGLKTGETFSTADIDTETLGYNFGIEDNSIALKWKDVSNVDETAKYLLKISNGDGSKTTVYTLVVNNKHICDSNIVSGGSSATCTSSGYTSSHSCSICGKVQSGGGSIPATGHKLTAVEAKAATCTEDGVVAHYACSTCKGTFADAEGKTTIATTVEKAKGHKIEKVEAKKETCSEDGNKEHYKCTGCNELYLDVEGKTVIKEEDIKVAMHEKSKVDEEKATYLKEGTKEHYVCACGKFYSDAEGKNEVTKEDLVIDKLLVGKTSKVAVGTRTRTSLKLAWNKVKDAAGYRVYVSKNGSWVALKTLTGTSYTATGLSAGTKYTFAVRAYVKEEGEVVWANSQKKVYTTVSAATRPAKTSYIAINARNKNSVKISWNSVKGATGYRVYYKQKGSFKAFSTQTGRSCTVTGLKRKTKYIFAVKAYTKEGSTVVWSDVYTTRTTTTK